MLQRAVSARLRTRNVTVTAASHVSSTTPKASLTPTSAPSYVSQGAMTSWLTPARHQPAAASQAGSGGGAWRQSQPWVETDPVAVRPVLTSGATSPAVSA